MGRQTSERRDAINRNIPKIAATLSLFVSLSTIGQPAYAKASFAPLKNGMRNAQVQEVEKMLAALNFDYKLKVDKKTLEKIEQQYAKLKKQDTVMKPDSQVLRSNLILKYHCLPTLRQMRKK